MILRRSFKLPIRNIQAPIPSRSLFTSPSTPSRNPLRTAAFTTLFLVSSGLFAVYYFDARSAIHRYFFTPLIRYGLDAETGHKVAVKVLRTGWGPRDPLPDDERLQVELWGEQISNPVGLAAGFDKNGEAIDGLFDLGFGWVEIGSVTPKPQPGNPTPRVFHLPSDSALINRYGFNSEGATSVLSRLRARLPKILAESNTGDASRASLRPGAMLAVNLGKNKSSSPDSINDFITGIRLFGHYADVLVVNVSSPNTPGLRGLQTRGMLEELLAGITHARDQLHLSLPTARRPKILLKIAPDLSDGELKDIAEAVAGSSIDGVIVSNTTLQRPDNLTDPRKSEAGGLSGRPLKSLSLNALRKLRAHLPSSVPLIGCGGISSGADALDYAKAGASAVQIYTGFGYDGVGACRRIKDQIVEELQSEGTTWAAIVSKASNELSAKAPPKKVPSPVQNDQAGDARIRQLVEEALDIKKQLDGPSERLG